MFDADPNIALRGIAARNKIYADHNRAVAESNGRIAAGWERTARDVARQRDELEARVAALEAENAELRLALLVEKAHAGGMKAYRDDLRAAHPNSPRLAPSGQKFRKSGNPKPLAALAYDREFDRILRDARIPNPEQYRD